MPERTLYDGINSDATAIKAKWQPGNLVAGYSSGTFAWSPSEWDLFPVDARVRITPSSFDLSADVIDCETGDASEADARTWVLDKRTQGTERPTIYRSLAFVPSLIQVMGPRLVLGEDWDLWVADWDGTTAIPWPHAAAKQFANQPADDISVVYDDLWPRRGMPPVTANFHLQVNRIVEAAWDQVPAADHYNVYYAGSRIVQLRATSTPVMSLRLTPLPSSPAHGELTVVAIVHGAAVLVGSWQF